MLYTIEEQFDIVDSYIIVKQKDSNISMKDVIFLTCIVDSIQDSIESEEE